MSRPAGETENNLLNVRNLDDELTATQASEHPDQHYAADEISPGKRISLHFSLAPEDDPAAIIDSNFDKTAVSFEFGDGNLLPGFEHSMLGMKAGDKKTLTIKAEQAFGHSNEDNIRAYPAYQFPADLVLAKGLMINFSDVGGNEQAGVVRDFNADEVIIDFNHPLAGLNILFTVEIKAVTPI